MGDINKYNYGLDTMSKFNYKDKKKNVNNKLRYMFNRSNIMFQYEDLPETIPHRELELQLQINGFTVFFEHDGKYYVAYGGLGGEPNAYNMPTEVVVTVPYLKLNKTFKIDVDCVVIPNDTMYLGLLPLYDEYCTLLNENVITMLLATVNRRVQNLLSANDDATIESARAFQKKVFDGELDIIAESKLFNSLKVNNSTSNAQVDLKDLFEFHQYLKASLYNEIGLSANFNMKRERLTANEVEANTDNLYPLVDDMLYNRRKAFEKIKEIFGVDIKVEFNSSWDYRLNNGEPITSDDNVIEFPTEEDNVSRETSDEITDENVSRETSEEKEVETSEETTDDATETVENTEETTDDTTETDKNIEETTDDATETDDNVSRETLEDEVKTNDVDITVNVTVNEPTSEEETTEETTEESEEKADE